MTTSLETRLAVPFTWRPQWTVPAAIVLVVLSRIPFLWSALSSDEAGYLIVGKGWDGPGTSLYGNYWVDRPPGLILLFRLAALLGGQLSLRLLGVVCAVVVVVLVWLLGRRLQGDNAGRWAAVVAALWLANPLIGAQEVDGELLAAPFVIGAVLCFLQATEADLRLRWWAAAGGASAATAVLVKQNHIDAFVYLLALLIVGVSSRWIDAIRALRVLAFAAIGAATVVAAMLWLTRAWGTSWSSLWFALYHFRAAAGEEIARSNPGPAIDRMQDMLAIAAVSGLGGALLLALADRVSTSRRPRPAPVLALGAWLGWGAFSIIAGGGFWERYLIEVLAPLAVILAIAFTENLRGATALLVLSVSSALIVWPLRVAANRDNSPKAVGSAISTVARADDTIITVWGSSNINYYAGLSSPYSQLWALPRRVLDPDLTAFNTTLAGPNAPTWLVTRLSVRSGDGSARDPRRIISQRYRPVTTICDRTVLLLDGVRRSTPMQTVRCGSGNISGGFRPLG